MNRLAKFFRLEERTSSNVVERRGRLRGREGKVFRRAFYTTRQLGAVRRMEKKLAAEGKWKKWDRKRHITPLLEKTCEKRVLKMAKKGVRR